MALLDIRILPPLAVGRLGASDIPLQAFDLEVDPAAPLGFRTIVPRESFEVDADSGAIAAAYVPSTIRFKDAGPAGKPVVRPVAPFLEVFVATEKNPDTLVPLTLDLLAREGLGVQAVRWSVTVGNIKIYRRTGERDDKIIASTEVISDHAVYPLEGRCRNFLPGRRLPLGSVRFIRPTAAFPEIRLRFCPAAGNVYGASRERIEAAGQRPKDDPIIDRDELVLYDCTKGKWLGYRESAGPTLTNPAQIYAGYVDGADQVSWGYLDDECDGFVRVELHLGEGRVLHAQAHIGAGPPAFAPDSLPPRAVSDELEQILLGPHVEGPVRLADAEDVVRRALETVHLMNVAVMNGNPVDDRENVASTMVRQDTNDFERFYEPIMSGSLVDTLAVRALHERVYGGMGGVVGPWFGDALRRPEEIGDLSSEGRRKMPGLMRNADGRALCLTRRMIDTVVKAASQGLFGPSAAPAAARGPGPLAADDVVAELHHRGAGNPFSVLPRTAISNCFPGLEYDFRNLWRRALEGIVLVENNNYVVAAEPSFEDLVGRRLLSVDGRPTMVVTEGPVFPGGESQRLATTANPNAVSFMEWSNSLAHVLQKQGQEVECQFTRATGDDAEVEVLLGDLEPAEIITRKLRVRTIFDGDTAAFAEGLLEPGELTQGLCSPWQNDYRECACYYWAASRPDYVNVEPGPDGQSRGDSWLAKRRTGSYIPDNRTDTRLLSYDDLFRDWQGELRFVIGGRDADETRPRPRGDEGGKDT